MRHKSINLCLCGVYWAFNIIGALVSLHFGFVDSLSLYLHAADLVKQRHQVEIADPESNEVAHLHNFVNLYLFWISNDSDNTLGQERESEQSKR